MLSVQASILTCAESPASHNGARFGEAVALGDMNGDGKADVAVGAPDQNVPFVSASPTPSLTPSPTAAATGTPTASPSPSPMPTPFPGNVGQGRVYLFDPAPPPTPTPTPVDSDTDGWSDSAEATIGTDPLDACADDLSDDAWPADINNNGFSDIADIALLTAVFGQSVPPAPARRDISPDPPDGFVDTQDIARMTALFGQSCAS